MRGGVLDPRGEEAVGRQDVELVLEEALHPLDVVVLPPDLQLVRDEVAQLPAGDHLQVLQGVVEHLRQVGLDLRGGAVDLLHLRVNRRQQFLQLVLSLFQVGVHLVDLGGDLREIIADLLEGVCRHGSLGVRAVDLAADAHALVAILAEELVLVLLVVGTVAEIEDGLLAERLAFVLAGDLVLVMLEIALLAEIGLLRQAVVRRCDVGTFLADHALSRPGST